LDRISIERSDMKARITKMYEASFKRVDVLTDDIFEIEADSIEIIEERKDEPVRRKTEEGDCGITKDGQLIIAITVREAPYPYERKIDWYELRSFEGMCEKHLFNLLDLVAEMKKAKDGTTQFFLDGLQAKIYDSGKICFFGHSMSKSDAFAFACQLIALCGENK
jgi:hypothetical protein